MSIQAVAWALEQDFSYTTPKGRQTSAHGAKLVLISLANHADHVSGHCWPSAPTIAKESSCNLRSVYRLIAALERNGFIDVRRSRGGADNRQRSNNYWIRFDRQPAPWQFFVEDDSDDEVAPPDTVSPDDTDTVSPPENVENCASEVPENATESPGRSDIGVTRQETLLEPSVLEPSAPEPAAVVDQVRVFRESDLVKGFDPNARQHERQRLQAAEEARKPKAYPVIRGSEPWKAHVAAGHPDSLFTSIDINGRKDWGWYFPTLWPPKKADQTGPPPASKKAG